MVVIEVGHIRRKLFYKEMETVKGNIIERLRRSAFEEEKYKNYMRKI